MQIARFLRAKELLTEAIGGRAEILCFRQRAAGSLQCHPPFPFLPGGETFPAAHGPQTSADSPSQDFTTVDSTAAGPFGIHCQVHRRPQPRAGCQHSGGRHPL